MGNALQAAKQDVRVAHDDLQTQLAKYQHAAGNPGDICRAFMKYAAARTKLVDVVADERRKAVQNNRDVSKYNISDAVADYPPQIRFQLDGKTKVLFVDKIQDVELLLDTIENPTSAQAAAPASNPAANQSQDAPAAGRPKRSRKNWQQSKANQAAAPAAAPFTGGGNPYQHGMQPTHAYAAQPAAMGAQRYGQGMQQPHYLHHMQAPPGTGGVQQAPAQPVPSAPPLGRW